MKLIKFITFSLVLIHLFDSFLYVSSFSRFSSSNMPKRTAVIFSCNYDSLLARLPYSCDPDTLINFNRNKYCIPLFSTVGVFFGSSTGNTERAADLIARQIGPDAKGPYDIDTIKGGISSEFMKHDALVVGTPTWNTGADQERSGTGWDEIYYNEMQDLSISGKKVAVFGLGDQSSYAENYADASGELHDVFKNLGCKMIGYTSQEGYEHEDSKAIQGEKFCGLLLDEVNQEDMTETRIKNWVAQLKDEGLLQKSSSGLDKLEVAVSPTKSTTMSGDKDTISTLIRDNKNLRRVIEEQSRLLQKNKIAFPVHSDDNGFIPHFNSRTGRTMWTSLDGKSCYYTTKLDSSI